MLDLIDGLILAGGDDIDPACYGAEPPSRDPPHGARARPRRDRARRAGRSSATCRCSASAAGMQLINVAFGGTLRQHLPEELGHEEHRRTPGSFDGLRPRRAPDPGLARRPRRRRGAPRHQVPPPPGGRPASATGSRSPATRRSTTCPEAIEAPGRPVRARRPVAPRGRRAEPRDRRARRAGARLPQRAAARRTRRRGTARGARASAWAVTARLEHELHRGLAHVQVEPLADVLDVEQVRAAARRRARAAAPASPGGRAASASSTSRRPAWLSWRRATSASSPASTLPPDSTTTVVPDGAAGDPARQQRGHADRARALDDELGALEQEHHRLGDLVLVDRRPRRRPTGRSATASARRAA